MEAALNESESILGSSSAPTIEPSAEIEVESGPVASPTAVAGVEENVNSRFIDYSIATPWEDLIASIERGFYSPVYAARRHCSSHFNFFPSISL